MRQFNPNFNNPFAQDYRNKLAEIQKEAQDKMNALTQSFQTNMNQPGNTTVNNTDAVPMQQLGVLGEVRSLLIEIRDHLKVDKPVETIEASTEPLVKEVKKAEVKPDKKQ